jgi:hypothetical protein
MTKLILMAAIVAGATVFVPQPVAAQDCTREYQTCLNDTSDTTGFTRWLADIECFARYTACIKNLY